MSFRAGQVFVACCLSLVGLSVAALRLLANPASRLSRWVDGRIDEAVTLPAPARRPS